MQEPRLVAHLIKKPWRLFQGRLLGGVDFTHFFLDRPSVMSDDPLA